MAEDIIEKAFAELEANIDQDELYLADYQTALVQQLENCDPEKYIRRVFGLFEKYPSADWGMPGELVHYLESLDGVLRERELIASVERCPVSHTLWMLNRQCNSKRTKEEAEPYCGIFRAVMERDGISDGIRNEVRSYLDYQSRRLGNL